MKIENMPGFNPEVPIEEQLKFNDPNIKKDKKLISKKAILLGISLILLLILIFAFTRNYIKPKNSSPIETSPEITKRTNEALKKDATEKEDLNIKITDEAKESTETTNVKFTFYKGEDLVVYDNGTLTPLDYKPTKNLILEFPEYFEQNKKLATMDKEISVINQQYVQFDAKTQTTQNLISTYDANRFLQFSPDNRYALFLSAINPKTLIAIDTFSNANEKNKVTEMKRFNFTIDQVIDKVGEFEWVGNDAIYVKCSGKLYRIDGEIIKLSTSINIPCEKQGSFVRMSPNTLFTFAKLTDTFELYGYDGQKVKVQDPDNIFSKLDNTEKFIWLNDDYMLIYFETPNNIYLYDRKANIVKLLIENAYIK